jgi:hypothetical protein
MALVDDGHVDRHRAWLEQQDAPATSRQAR